MAWREPEVPGRVSPGRSAGREPEAPGPDRTAGREPEAPGERASRAALDSAGRVRVWAVLAERDVCVERVRCAPLEDNVREDRAEASEGFTSSGGLSEARFIGVAVDASSRRPAAAAGKPPDFPEDLSAG